MHETVLRRVSLASLAVLAACAAPPSQAPGAGIFAAGPDREALLREARVPGLALAVIDDGEVVATELLGVASAESSEPVTERTLFEAASLSKPVFAAAVLRLAERGELDLDRPLAELLESERIAHDPRSRLITARLVLSHRTGLPNWGPEKLDFIAEPGEWFGYSGEGYVYLQRVVEAHTGLTLDELVRREVFAPLSMSHSRFAWPEGSELALAAPHDAAGRAQPKNEPREGNAAASLHTTAADYARFVTAWMGGELLSAATLDEALGPQSRPQPPEEGGVEGGAERGAASERIAWGLGWGMQLPPVGDGSAPLYWHWGDNGPAKAWVAFDPATGDGLVYFANGANGLAIAPPLTAAVLGDMDVTFDWLDYERVDAPGFAERLAGFVAESEGRYAEAVAAFRAALVADPGDEVTARRVEWLAALLDVERRPVELPDATLARYAGTYGPRRLDLEDGALYYQRGGGTRYRLIPLGPTLFALDGMPSFRLEVVAEGDAPPAKLVGHYVEGQTDESARTP